MKSFFSLFLLLILTTLTNGKLMAQMGKEDGSRFGHGEDSVSCITNLSLFGTEYKDTKDYERALLYWRPVFDECPKASKNTYIRGANMLKKIIVKTSDQTRKNNLIDTLMLVYDRRIEYFGEEGKVKERWGTDLLNFRRNDGIEYVQQGYNLLKDAINLRQLKSSKAVLPTMLSASITLFSEGLIDAGQIIKDYLLVTDIIDQQIANKPNDRRLPGIKEAIDANFESEGPADCQILVEYFTKEHASKKEDIDFLTIVTKMLRSRECTNSELFFVASKDLHRLAPTASSAINIALLARDRDNYEDAIKYYQQAIELESEEDKKADYYYGIAVIYQKLDQKAKSKEYALMAAKVKPAFGEPYMLIGQLYVDSKDECSSLKLPNSIYWVAVDMFIKAKQVDATLEERANKLILTYSKYFPNEEKAFFHGIEEGDNVKVECWINQTTIARFE